MFSEKLTYPTITANRCLASQKQKSPITFQARVVLGADNVIADKVLKSSIKVEPSKFLNNFCKMLFNRLLKKFVCPKLSFSVKMPS